MSHGRDDDSTVVRTVRVARRPGPAEPSADPRPGGVAGGRAPPPQDPGSPNPRRSDQPPDPAAPPEPLPCGRFDLQATVGRGAYGTVWRGRDRDRGLPVAVKVVHAEVPDAERASLLHEARAVASLDHPGIVRIVDLGSVTTEEAARGHGHLVTGAPWLAMDLVRGGTLRDEVGKVDWPRLRDVLTQLLDALAHAHAAGIVHRDLKPANVLREGRRVVVSDFGIAAVVGSAQEDTICGTPAYMSPEQIRGEWRAFGPWTDLYSVGCLAWALATGRAPFPGKGMAVMQAHLTAEVPEFLPNAPMPEGLEPWLRQLLRKRPSERPTFAADAARSLAAIDGGPRGWSLPASGERDDDWLSAHIDVAEGERLIGMRSVPLIGRGAERRHLWEHLRRVVERGTTLVDVLRGPTGIGKSRLAAWLCQRAHELGAARVVELAVGADLATGAGAAVARSAGADGLGAPEAEERLSAAFGHLLPRSDLRALANLCALGAPGVGAGSARLAQPAWRLAVLARWLRALSIDRPVILRIEDAHRDPEALALARVMLDPRDARTLLPGEHGVLVLVTLRDDTFRGGTATDPFTSSAAATAIQRALTALAQAGADMFSIGPLDEEEQRALLRMASGVGTRRGLGLSPALASAVLRRADGNPLFVEQIVRGWAASGAIVQTARGLESRDGGVPPLDEDLSAAWAHRVEQLFAALPDEARSSVELAATLGTRFDVRRWMEACRHAGVSAHGQGLDVLAAQRLVARPSGAPPDTYAILHGGLREALLAMAHDRGRAERWHLACARVHEGTAGGRGDIRARALHLAQTREYAAAIVALAEAAADAERHGQTELNSELVALRRRALTEGGIAASDPAHGEQLCLEADNALLLGHWSELEARALRALEQGRAHGWARVVARATLLHGLFLSHVGRVADAAPIIDAAVESHRTLGVECPREQLGNALRVQGDAQTALAHFDAAMAAFDEARTVYAGTDDAAGAARCDVGAALVLRLRGDRDRARRALAAARALFQRAGHLWGEAVCINDTADLLRLDGDLDSAEAGYREACDRYLALGTRPLIPDINRALLLAERGRFADARAVLDPLRDYVARSGRNPLLVYIEAARAECCYATGDPEGGRAAFDAADALLAETPVADDELARCLNGCARHAFACGDGDVALRAAARARLLADAARGA
jgi:tetratricopeptide (TPR) repeat protein